GDGLSVGDPLEFQLQQWNKANPSETFHYKDTYNILRSKRITFNFNVLLSRFCVDIFPYIPQ
ncbi:MAG: hypothetical protein WBW34_08810, partial [Nitrososphaeraceae archaeon]